VTDDGHHKNHEEIDNTKDIHETAGEIKTHPS